VVDGDGDAGPIVSRDTVAAIVRDVLVAVFLKQAGV